MSDPGDHVRWFAEKQGWKVSRRNIVVEGEIDMRYFLTADRLYRSRHRIPLITEDLSIFPIGKGLNGGARKVASLFPTFQHLIETDLGRNSEYLFRAIALLDSDPVGMEAYESITTRCVNIRGGRDVFLLARVFPRTKRSPTGYHSEIEAANKQWAGLCCEMEDLLPLNLVREFLSGLGFSPDECVTMQSGGFHLELDTSTKSKLCAHCEQRGTYEDLLAVIDLLKSLRFYLGLPVPEN